VKAALYDLVVLATDECEVLERVWLASEPHRSQMVNFEAAMTLRSVAGQLAALIAGTHNLAHLSPAGGVRDLAQGGAVAGPIPGVFAEWAARDSKGVGVTGRAGAHGSHPLPSLWAVPSGF
jgi:hypothetical protein